MSDPIDYCREIYETEKGDGQFLVSRSDTAVTFDAAEEVLDGMAMSIKASAVVIFRSTGKEGRTPYQKYALPGREP